MLWFYKEQYNILMNNFGFHNFLLYLIKYTLFREFEKYRKLKQKKFGILVGIFLCLF